MAVIAERGKGLDVLFANAGVGEFATLEQTTEAQFDQTFAINVKGALFTVQKALPLLNPGASIVLAGSSAATRGTPSFGTYGATKAAVRAYARTWAAELADRDIRVNVIAPGPIDTPAINAIAPDPAQAQTLRDTLAGQVPIGRLGHPDEIAAAVAFLASPQCSFITGAELAIDGGLNQI
jgi:NAD(P)-dependent dehydrogenase (short-subunit alcohol dehydrogenase family)